MTVAELIDWLKQCDPGKQVVVSVGNSRGWWSAEPVTDIKDEINRVRIYGQG